jgi:hypothetical protein
MTTPADPRPCNTLSPALEQAIHEFRKEVNDKLNVVQAGAGNSLLTLRRIAFNQCEDFLVEEATRLVRQASAEAHAEIDRLTFELDMLKDRHSNLQGAYALRGMQLEEAHAEGRRALPAVLTAPDEEVGPACMNVLVPPTIAMDDAFREPYVQGYRHALADIRRQLAESPRPTPPETER